MRKPAANSHIPGACEEALRDLLLAAASPDNLDSFLRRIIRTLCTQCALGAGSGLAIVLRRGKNAAPFISAANFTRAELGRFSDTGKRPKNILCAGFQGGTMKGSLLARLAGTEAAPCAGQLLELAAKVISGRLAQEGREGQLIRERDIADAISHLEELYLAFPSISIEEISRTILDEARRLTGSRFGFAGYISPPSGGLVIPAVTEEAAKGMPADGKELAFREFRGLWGWVLKTKKPLLTNRAASDPRAKGVPAGHAKIERFAAAPAISGKKLIGILAMANPPGDYPPAAMDAVKKLARVYALMLRHKLAERQQQADDTKHKSILDTSRDLIYNLTVDGKLTYVSRAVENYGYTAKEIIGHSFLEFTHPQDKKRIEKAFRAAVRTGSPLPLLSYRLLKKDGSYALVEQKSAILPRAGAAPLVTGVMRDVTDYRRTAEQLAETELKYKKIFEKANAAIIIADAATGTILDVNKDAEKLTGRTRGELIGMNRQKLHPPEAAAHYKKQFGDHARKGLATLIDAEVVRKDGSRAQVRISTSKLTLDGRAVLQGIFHDVSERIKTDEKYRALVESTDTGYLILNDRGQVLDANKEYLRLTGRARLRDILGRRVTEWTAPYDKARNKREVEDCLKNGYVRNLTVDYIDRRGNIIPIEVNATVVRTGNAFQIVSLCRDITERKQAEFALRGSEEKYRRLVENLGKEYFFYRHDTRGVFDYLSPSITGTLGYSQKEFLTHYTQYLTSSPRNKEVIRHTKLTLRGIQQPAYEVEIYHKDGSIHWLEVTETPLRDTDGKVIGVEGLAHDITARKQAEARQRTEEARFKAIISSSKDIIYTAGLDGRITYMSPIAAEYGYAPEELIGCSAVDFTHPDDKEFVTKAFANAVRTGKTLPILPYRIKKKEGSYFYAEQKSGVVFENGKPAYITGVIRDVTEQRKTETRLKENEALIGKIFDTASDAIFIKDMNGLYMAVNKAFAGLYNMTPEEILGKSDSDLFSAEIAALSFKEDSEVVRSEKTLNFTRSRELPAGKFYLNTVKTPMRNIEGKIIGLLGIARDITALKRMETELALASAAAAISNVARPMAHDFNNALAAINGYATLIEDDLKPDSPIKTEISRIIEAVKRAAVLTSKFQDFARNPKIENPGETGGWSEATQFNKDRKKEGN